MLKTLGIQPGSRRKTFLMNFQENEIRLELLPIVFVWEDALIDFCFIQSLCAGQQFLLQNAIECVRLDCKIQSSYIYKKNVNNDQRENLAMMCHLVPVTGYFYRKCRLYRNFLTKKLAGSTPFDRLPFYRKVILRNHKLT
jgi:hypothetical protein